MSFSILTAQPSNGKSLKLSMIIDDLYHRNVRWFEITGKRRRIAVNMTLSSEYLEGKEEYFVYWQTWHDLLKLRDCDIIWDEISILLDSYMYEKLTMAQLHWLTHYARFGIEIYSATQFFNQVAKRARQLATQVIQVNKLMGSPRPSPTKPPVKKVWGVFIGREMLNYQSEEALTEPEFSLIPSFIHTIQKKYTDIFDTREVIKPESWIEARSVLYDIKQLEALKKVAKSSNLPHDTIIRVLMEKEQEFGFLVA